MQAPGVGYFGAKGWGQFCELISYHKARQTGSTKQEARDVAILARELGETSAAIVLTPIDIAGGVLIGIEKANKLRKALNETETGEKD